MLKRKVEKKINNWLANETVCLLISGVRQCGKSTSIRNVLKQTNTDFVEFNLIDQKELVPVFNQAISESADALLQAIRFASRKVLKEGTVIFVDEVQECKDFVTMIKFLVEKGNYRYILSGSLLGVELTGLRSAPVGYLHIIDMYPMDLEEFLWANGVNEETIENLKESCLDLTPLPEGIHDIMMKYFYRYLLVGGMPQAVQAYINTGDLNIVSDIHEQIVALYKMDFTKYEEKDKKLQLIKTYELIPSELNSKNKRYQFSDLGEKYSKYDRYENSFNWLNDAGVSLPVCNVTEYQIPLEASKKSNLFKLFLSDVGMLTSLYGIGTKMKLLERSSEINNGALFENAVAQELFAHGYKTYYFNNKKHGEVDFLIEEDGELLPIEVKSGKEYTKHSALTYFMNTRQFKKAIVFSNYNVSVDNEIIYLPIYMTMFLNNHKRIKKIEAIDASILNAWGKR